MTKHPDAPRPVILCVDDETGILHSIRRSLKQEPVEVLTAGSGLEALQLLRDRQVALLLTDYRMPEMNGIELLEQVARLSPDTFRIIVTGYAEANILTDAINQGRIYKVLYKPFQEEDMRLTVRSSLEHFAQVNQNRALLQLLNEMPAAVVGLEHGGHVVFANGLGGTWFRPPASGASIVGTYLPDAVPAEVGQGIRKVLNGESDEQRMTMTALQGIELAVSCRAIKQAQGLGSAPQIVVFAVEQPS